MFDWKKDLVSKLPKGKGSVKNFGRSNDAKFNTIMKSVGADKNSISHLMDGASKVGNPSSLSSVRRKGYGDTAESWDNYFAQKDKARKAQLPKKPTITTFDRFKHSLGIDLSKEKENLLANENKPKKHSTERNGVLGALDSTLGRIGNTANEMAFGKGFNDAQNANYKKLAESKLKAHPNDNHAIQSLQMFHNATRPAKNKVEKVSDFIGNTAGVMAPYTIGGAYGTAEKGLQALSKLKTVEKGVQSLSKTKYLKPLAGNLGKDLVRGLGAGAIAGSERAGMHKVASNEKVSGKDIALESALAGGGDAALGALLRNLNLKGHLNTVLHDNNKNVASTLSQQLKDVPKFAESINKISEGNPKEFILPNGQKTVLKNRVTNELSSTNSQIAKPNKDYLPIEQQKFGTKLARAENNIPTSDIPSLPKQEEKIILSQDKNPLNLKRRLNQAYQNTFDTQHLIAGISNDVKVNASNARQTQGVTDFIAEHGLVDKEGNKIGESLKELAQSIPLNKENDFWRYVAHQHNIARSKEGKNVFSQFNAADSDKEAQKLLAGHPEFKDAGEKVTNWINKFMGTWADDLVGEDALKMWRQMYPDYVPVYREIDPLKQASFNGAKRGFVNQHNLVKGAKGAKADLSSDIKDPLGNIVQLVNKTVKAQKNNEVGKSVLEEVRKGGLDDLFEIVKTKPSFVDDINTVLKNEGIEGVMDKFTGQFDDVFKQAEKGNNIVKVMENGHEVLLKVKDLDYLKALQSLSDGTGKTAAEQFERAARKTARPIKDLITGKNPLFAIFNFMRDTPTAFIQGAENNPVIFANRYMRALKEITHNSKGFQEFAAQGGMQSGFFKNDVLKTTSQLKNLKVSHFGKFMNKVEAFNNLIEAAPRYMEYLATLEKGGTKAQAIYNAAEVTTNFARNGKWGKFFDSFVLYLNPALQGLDKFVRQVKNKPLQTALKAGGVVTIPQVATEFINKDNPNYQSLDQRIKDDFFLIPNMFGPQDAQGNSETFFRIPKTREYSVVFSVLTNRIGELMRGESLKNASKGVVGSFDRNFSVPTRPIWSPFSDVARNKDWKNAPINPLGMTLDNRSNYLKFDERTSEIGKFLSKALNEQPIDGLKYSPKDIDYLIQSYTGIIGDILLPTATKNDSALGIPQKKFFADSVYSNQSVNDFYDNMQKLKTRASNKNILENIPSKIRTQEEIQRDNVAKLSKLIGDLNESAKQTQDKNKQRELRKQVLKLTQQGNNLYNQYTK